MQKQWVGKNVDLALLSECVETFFKNRGLKTMKEFSKDEYTIFWASPRVRDARGDMRVKIQGDPNNFRMEYLGGEEVHRSILLGLATTLFGGGYLIRESLKLKDVLEKVEGGFWAYIENEVECLVGSAKSPEEVNCKRHRFR